MSSEEAEIAALLLGLEKHLMDPAVRKDRAQVSALLAEDFREFGSSGRHWSREAILDLLATEPVQPAPAVEGFEFQFIGPGTALVTYRTVRPQQSTLRSSIWQRTESGWQILFHQGTKIPDGLRT
jgi:hypothetical protein